MYIAPHLWKIFEDLEDQKKLDLEKKNQKLGLEKFLSPTFFSVLEVQLFFGRVRRNVHCAPPLENFRGPRGPKKKLDLEKKFTLLKPITRTTGF